jgi:hypothetical protein
MNGLLNTLLTHKLPETERKWYHVIIWWELRRIPYNLTLLVTGILGILCMTLVVDGGGDFVSGLAIMGFAFLANFFYTFGWVVELFIRFFNRQKATWFGLKSFKVGFIIAICGTFVPSLIFGVVGLIRGEKFSSPYSHFATTEPKFSDIVGEYELSDLSKKQLNFPDSINKKTVIRFNDDSTFVLENFPEHGMGMELTDYRISNSSGKWKIESDNGHWVIPMDIKISTDIKSNITDSSGMYNSNGFNVYNNKPPYDIYIIIGDPDSWYGLTLQKK